MSMAGALALGGGLVGRFVCARLAASGSEVRLIDMDGEAVEAALDEGVDARLGDALTAASEEPLSSADVVLNLLPGSIGHAARIILVERGATVVDLAFSPEDAHDLGAAAIASGSIVVHDPGIAPGLSNMIVANAHRRLGPLQRCVISVGGNPSKPDQSAAHQPTEEIGRAIEGVAEEAVNTTDGWSYMAPFSPRDVIEEYTRPARIRRAGRIVTVPALSERHPITIEGKGIMEAFLTDGLRSLLSLDIADLVEETIRWPGHIDRWLAFAPEGIVTEKDEAMLLDAWRYDSERSEFTHLRVEIEPRDGNREMWIVEDEGADGWSSMARTTGIVTETIARSIMDGSLTLEAGVHAPEELPPSAFEATVAAMRDAGVKIRHEAI